MRKNKNIFIYFGVCLLIILTYFIPNAVAVAEDKHLQTRQEIVALENVDFLSTDVNLYRELSGFQELMLGDVLTQNYSPEENENYEIIKTKVEEFLKLITYGNEEMNEYSATFFVISDQNSASNNLFHPIWKWNVKDYSENEYVFWFDELTGKVMAFKMKTLHNLDANYIVFNQRISKIMKYYGFTDFELCENNGESYICFYKESGTTRQAVELPYQKFKKEFYFNMMPF